MRDSVIGTQGIRGSNQTSQPGSLVRMKELVKCFRKLKEILVSSHRKKGEEHETSASPPCAIFCEDLFLPSKRKKCYRAANNDVDRDPFVAAQSHFSLRPNIYI
ncbi:hypothetical protein SDJN03_29468, partial [Cucurbita argyrosperma subsp. sororia]